MTVTSTATMTVSNPMPSEEELAAYRANFRPTPIPKHIKQMRRFLIGTVVLSACSIWASIPLAINSSVAALSTTALAAWTLVHLYPQELGHYEYKPEISLQPDGTGVKGEKILKPEKKEGEEQRWVVEEEVARRSYTIATAWGVCAARSAGVIGYHNGVVPQEAWIVVVLETAAAVTMYMLAKLWSEERAKWTNAQRVRNAAAAKKSVNGKKIASSK